MKNKLFWPIVLVSIVIIVESILLLSNDKAKKMALNNAPIKDNVAGELVEKEVVEPVINFMWLDEDGKTVLVMQANKAVAIDAIDLYISYKDLKVNSVDNAGDLPKPSFSKISTEKSLVVMNYLISEAEGFKMVPGQKVKVAELDMTLLDSKTASFSVDPKTQVVENGTAKVLPY